MMKRKDWILLAVLLCAVVLFFVYTTLTDAVRDTKGPEILISDEILEVSVSTEYEALLQGITAKDAVDGDVTASLIVERVSNIDSDQIATVTYAAFDAAGNVTKASRKVRYTDYTSPRFTLSRPLVFTVGSTFDLLSFVGAEDVIDGNLDQRVKATSLDSAAITAQGVHAVQFRVTNSLGDTSELELPVDVRVAGGYSGTATLTDYIIYLQQGASFDPMDYLHRFTVGTNTVSLRGTIPSYVEVETEGQVDTSVPGVYPVSYTVTYQRTGEPHEAYTKLIVVVEG